MALVDLRQGESAAPERSRAHGLTHRELELGAIIDAYNRVTERLKVSHETLAREVGRLRRQLGEKDRELQRRERMAALGEMAAGVAHEVRNPLGGILLYATMLQEDLKQQPAWQRLAYRIAGAARKLDAIVGDILAFADQREPKRRPTQLDALLLETIELLGPHAGAAGCRVTMDSNRPDLIVEGDAVHLQRAFLNVLSNAIDAAGAGGHVWITLDERGVSGSEAAIRVADDGSGVSDDLKDRIFNPFFTTKDSGTGLGLAIVHRIIELHGGRVIVADRPGGGAVFTLLLPKQAGDGA